MLYLTLLVHHLLFKYDAGVILTYTAPLPIEILHSSYHCMKLYTHA